MKVFLRLLSIAGLVFIATGCKTRNGAERPQLSTVIGLSGNARYWDTKSNKAHAIRLGALIPPGSTIETDNGTTNAVILQIGRRVMADMRIRDPRHPYNITLYGNTSIKLDKVTSKTVAGSRIPDIRLFLKTGEIGCETGMLWPSDAMPRKPLWRSPEVKTLKPNPNTPYYELKTSNIVIHAEQALFGVSTSGISVIAGAVAVEFADTRVIKNVFGWERCDFTTAEISELKEGHSNSSYDSHDEPSWKYLLRNTRRTPDFQFPQRLF